MSGVRRVDARPLKHNEDRFSQLRALVEAGLSYNEIRRVGGFDHRTVKRYYPDYHPFPVGGAGEAAVIRKVNQQLDEFLRRGKIGRNRENGFNPKA